MHVNTINCFLFLPHYFSPQKRQELLGHTVSQITQGTKQRCQVYLSLIHQKLSLNRDVCRRDWECGTGSPEARSSMQEGWRSWGVYTQTQAYSVTQVWNLFLSHCSGRSLVSAKTQTETASTLLSGQPLHPTDAGRVSTEKGKAVSGGKTEQKIILCFQQVFEASKSCICEVNGRVMAGFRAQKTFNFSSAEIQRKHRDWQPCLFQGWHSSQNLGALGSEEPLLNRAFSLGSVCTGEWENNDHHLLITE